MKAIDKVRSHYDKQEVAKKYIEEWDMTVYRHPITMSERGTISSRAEGDIMETLVYAIIYKAVDENGEKLFDISDKKALLTKADARIVTDLGSWCLQNVTEDQAKNS